MAAIRLGRSTAVFSLAATFWVVVALHAQSVAADVSGRWEFITDAPTPAVTGGRARGAGPQEPAVGTVTLELKRGPGGTLTGTVRLSGSGRAAAPGGNPSRPVEISDGTADGTRLSITVWQFDRYKNRTRYEGTLDGDRLALTMTRETANGAERTQAVALRKPY
jgi:hypothetical protein